MVLFDNSNNDDSGGGGDSDNGINDDDDVYKNVAPTHKILWCDSYRSLSQKNGWKKRVIGKSNGKKNWLMKWYSCNGKKVRCVTKTGYRKKLRCFFLFVRWFADSIHWQRMICVCVRFACSKKAHLTLSRFKFANKPTGNTLIKQIDIHSGNEHAFNM